MRKLVDFSEVIARGTVVSRAFLPEHRATRFMFVPTDFFKSEATVPLTPALEIIALTDNRLLTAGKEFVLFLALPFKGHVEKGYSVVGGYLGRYLVDGADVSMSCNREHDDPALAVDGEPLDAFVERIRSASQ